MNISRGRWMGLSAAVGTLVVLGGCAVGPGYYGETYYPEPAYIGGPSYPAYVDIDVAPRPRYWGGGYYRDNYPRHPGYYPGYRAPGNWQRPPGGRPPGAGMPPVARPVVPGGVPPVLNRPEFRPGPPTRPIPPRSQNDVP